MRRLIALTMLMIASLNPAAHGQAFAVAAEPPEHARLRADSRAGKLAPPYDLGNRDYFLGPDSRIIGDPHSPARINGTLITNWAHWTPTADAWTADGGFRLNPADMQVSLDANGNYQRSAISVRTLFWKAGESLAQPFAPAGWSSASTPIVIARDLRMDRWISPSGDTLAIGGLSDPRGHPSPVNACLVGSAGKVRVGLADAAGVEYFMFGFPVKPAPGERHRIVITIDPATSTVACAVDGVAIGKPQPFKGPLADNEDAAWQEAANSFSPATWGNGGWPWPATLYSASLTANGRTLPISPPPLGDWVCPGGGMVAASAPGLSAHWALPPVALENLAIYPANGSGLALGTSAGNGPRVTNVTVHGGNHGVTSLQAGTLYPAQFVNLQTQSTAMVSVYTCYAIAQFRDCQLVKPVRDAYMMRGGRTYWTGGMMQLESPRRCVNLLAYGSGWYAKFTDLFFDCEMALPTSAYFAADTNQASGKPGATCNLILDAVDLGPGPCLRVVADPANPVGQVTLRRVTSPDALPATSCGGVTVTGSINGD